MKKNLNLLDRTVRVLLAAVVAVLYFTGVISGTLAIVLLVLAIILVATGLISFCPLYALLGWSTNKESKAS